MEAFLLNDKPYHWSMPGGCSERRTGLGPCCPALDTMVTNKQIITSIIPHYLSFGICMFQNTNKLD